MPLSISVVVMAYNESDTLVNVTREIITTLEGLERDYEVIIVDDGSTDGTKTIAEGLVNEYSRIGLVCHDKNLGLGEVYRTGFIQSRCDLVTFFPADGQFPASILLQFVPIMENHDMVLGYLPERNSPIISKIFSRAERLLYSLLLVNYQNFKVFLCSGVECLTKSISNQLGGVGLSY